MGRKSKTKKIVREILQEKAKKGEKPSRPQSKKDLKKQVHHRSHRKHEKKSTQTQPAAPAPKKARLHHRLTHHLKKHRRSIFGGLLASIMLALLFCIAYLLFSKAFRPDQIAKFLPADSTVAVIEINTNLNHNQITKSFDLLKNYPQYSQPELIKKAETLLLLSYQSDLKPWLGRSTGIALFNSKVANAEISEVYFAEYLNKDELMKFLSAHSGGNKATFGQYEIFNLNKQFFATIIGQYLAISQSEETIRDLIAIQNSNTSPLSSSKKYRKIDDNLPLNRVAFGYLDFSNIQDSFFQRFPFLSEKGLNVSIIAPFIKIFDAEGIALVADKNNFVIQSFSSLNRSQGSTDLNLNLADYQSDLSALVKKDALLFWGAQDLRAQIKRLLNILSGDQDQVITVFNKVLNNYVKKYFGETVKLEDTILPLLSGEFAFALEPDAYKVLITLENGKTDALKFQDLAKQFATIGAIFAPKVVEHTLPDGTVSKEIIAVPEAITTNQLTYKETTIYSLTAGTQGWSIFYAFIGDSIVITTTQDSLKASIDLALNPAENLQTSKQFVAATSSFSGESAELSYFNIEPLASYFLGENPPDLIKIFASLTSEKSYSNDGITTINYLNLK